MVMFHFWIYGINVFILFEKEQNSLCDMMIVSDFVIIN